MTHSLSAADSFYLNVPAGMDVFLSFCLLPRVSLLSILNDV